MSVSRLRHLILAACAAAAATQMALGYAAAASVERSSMAVGNAPQVSPSAIVRHGRANIQITLPGAGTLTLKIVHHGHPIGRRTLTVRARGTRTVGVALAPSALQELRAGNISAGLRVTLVDADGARVTRPFGLRLKRG